MDLKLHKLKFFMRPRVLHELSEFAIASLKKLNLKKEKEIAALDEEDPMNDSFHNPGHGTADDKGWTMFMKFKMLKSILILERREFQKKAAVV